MALVVGMAIVGFVDDYLGVRRGRNMGLRKRGKTGGQILVAVGFALLALNYVNVSTHLSFTRVFDLDLGTGAVVRARGLLGLRVLQRGEPHRRRSTASPPARPRWSSPRS